MCAVLCSLIVGDEQIAVFERVRWPIVLGLDIVQIAADMPAIAINDDAYTVACDLENN